MSFEAYFRDPTTNSPAIAVPSPAATLEIELPNVPENSTHQFHIAFSDTDVLDGDNPSAVTAGNILFEVSSIAGPQSFITNSYFEGVPNGAIPAADVYTARPLPTALGPIKHAKVTLDNIEGAAFAFVLYKGFGI